MIDVQQPQEHKFTFSKIEWKIYWANYIALDNPPPQRKEKRAGEEKRGEKAEVEGIDFKIRRNVPDASKQGERPRRPEVLSEGRTERDVGGKNEVNAAESIGRRAHLVTEPGLLQQVLLNLGAFYRAGLVEVNIDVFPESARVVISHGLGISERCETNTAHE